VFSYRAKEGTNYPPDATIEAKKFVIKDFVVGSSIAVFGSVTADGTKLKVCFFPEVLIVYFCQI